MGKHDITTSLSSSNSMSNNEPRQIIPKPLTSRQERKLVSYLDDRFLEITRNFKKRTDPSSTLQTLSAYLDSVRRVLALILQIPPIDPSTSLRVAYLLRFTSDVFGAIPAYNVSSSGLTSSAILQDVVDFLDDLDQSWMAVLQNQIWDPDRAEGVDLVIPTTSNGLANADVNSSVKQYRSSPPSQTDVTRLRSLLFSGQSALEEWVSNQRNKGGKEDPGDVAMMLANMGLLDQFDSLFAQTLDYLGGFSGDVARNVVEPEMACA